MDTALTKDAQKLFCAMYKKYLEQRKSGISKKDANFFGSSAFIQNELMPDWPINDVEDTCRELSRAGFIACLWADNTASMITITDKGIIFMENRFKRGLDEVVDFISKFIP